jgi:hypothetical protein
MERVGRAKTLGSRVLQSFKLRRHDPWQERSKDRGDANMNDQPLDSGTSPRAVKPAARDPSPAAQRALEEAEARRAELKPAPPRELNGRGGLDPVRYGDWEVKGLASDF